MADVFRLQGSSLQKLVAEAIVEGTVKLWRTPMCVQNTEAFHLILSIHQQLRFVTIYPDQNHVLQDGTHVAAEEFISNSVSEHL